MPEESEERSRRGQESDWLLAPPHNKLKLVMNVEGQGDLTSEVRETLEVLVRQLHEADIDTMLTARRLPAEEICPTEGCGLGGCTLCNPVIAAPPCPFVNLPPPPP